MKPVVRSGLLLAALGGIGVLVSACADEGLMAADLRQANDFGRAVHEDLAAQIADPDANWKGPPPPSSGERAALAQKSYGADQVKQPQQINTQSSGGGTGGGGGSGGGGAGGGGGGAGP